MSTKISALPTTSTLSPAANVVPVVVGGVTTKVTLDQIARHGTTRLEDVGAVGDGVTNDAPAYSAALATGATIILGARNYLTTAGYTGSLATKQSIVGQGGQSLITNLSNQAIVSIGGDGCLVANLRLVGTFGAGASNHGIASAYSQTIIDNVWIDTPGKHGVYLGPSQSVANFGATVSNVRVYVPVNGAGIYIDGHQYASIVNCKGWGGTYGCYIDAGNAVVSGCNFDLNTYGLYVNNVNGNDGHAVVQGCTFNHNTTEAIHVEKLLNGLDVRDSEIYYADIRVIGGSGAGYPTLVRFKDDDIDVANWQLDGALVEVDGCKIGSANANTVNLAVNGHASTLIVRPNILKIDGTPFDFGVSTRWDTPSSRSHEHYFGGVSRHAIDGASGRARFGGGGSDFAFYAGPLPSFPTSYSGVHLLANGVNPNTQNACIDTNGADLFISSPHSSAFGRIYFYAYNSALQGTIDPVALKVTWPQNFHVAAKFSAQPWQAITLANGANNNVAVTQSSLRVTGPTGAFSITGLAQPVDGSSNVIDGTIVDIVNMTAQAMTISYENASSTAANRIDTLTGADVVLAARKSFARLKYDAVSSRWLLLDTR